MNPDGYTLNLDTLRSAVVFHHPTASIAAVLEGTATDGIDLSAYVTDIEQTEQDCNVTVSWHTQLAGANQPKVGEVLEVRLDGVLLWLGSINSLSDYKLARGTRQLRLVGKTRDASPMWRDTQRVGGVYPAGTDIGSIGMEIAQALALEPSEINLGPIGAYTVHSSQQMANCTAWDMLETIYQPTGGQPYVDSYGRLKTISRDTQRASDIVLTDDRVIEVSGEEASTPVDRVRIKWLDPNLSKAPQAPQSICNVSLTAGFFQPYVKKDLWFSDDRTQRAENTYLVIKQSANSGLVPCVSDEGGAWHQTSEFGGYIELDNTYWNIALLAAGVGGWLAAHHIPDPVQVGPTGTGFTQPSLGGRAIEGLSMLAVITAMLSIGTGSYEIWGTPYTMVHARNTSEAYNSNAQPWMERVTVIQSDYVQNEPMAQAYAIRELFYGVRSASSFGLKIVDDTRIEVGDIIELSTGERVYVTGYTRKFKRGDQAVLDIKGFKT